MRPNSTGQRQVTFGEFDVEPVFSPDGAKIAFARLVDLSDEFSADLYVMNRDGSGLRQVVAPRVGPGASGLVTRRKVDHLQLTST